LQQNQNFCLPFLKTNKVDSPKNVRKDESSKIDSPKNDKTEEIKKLDSPQFLRKEGKNSDFVANLIEMDENKFLVLGDDEPDVKYMVERERRNIIKPRWFIGGCG
jgi:hypothetical protein